MNATDVQTADVFVVDDNDLVRRGIVRMLENDGLVVKEFNNPRTFIAEIFAVKLLPRLVVSDYNMDDMTGVEIIRTLKSSPSHKRIPVLIVSAQTKADVQEQAKQAGAMEWIKKSAIGNELMPAVRKHLLRR